MEKIIKSPVPLNKEQQRIQINEYRHKRGYNAGIEGLPPDEATDAYLQGYLCGRKKRQYMKQFGCP